MTRDTKKKDGDAAPAGNPNPEGDLSEKKKKKTAKPTTKAKRRKKTGKRQIQGRRISAEQYNTLWNSYTRLQNIAAAARDADVDYETAARYIKGPGAPESGMVPIRDRFLRVQARSQQEQELDLLTFRRKEQKAAMNQLSILHGEMQLAFATVKKRLEAFNAGGGKIEPEREMSIKDLVVSYDKGVRLVEHLLGGADVTVGSTGQFDPLSAMTDEEALEYATTGRLPGDISRIMDEE